MCIRDGWRGCAAVERARSGGEGAQRWRGRAVVEKSSAERWRGRGVRVPVLGKAASRVRLLRWAATAR
eukprot:4000179-Prymnesium_polylepis.1